MRVGSTFPITASTSADSGSIASLPRPYETPPPSKPCVRTDQCTAGIAVRILGEVTPEKVEIARQADHVS